jgi:chaperone required for assembly of F1-ATPase
METPRAMKRFYQTAAIQAAAQGWQVTLDGRGIKTVGGRPQIVPSAALAEALAAEWAAQLGEIDPARFLLRDMADYAIDVVAHDPTDVLRGLMLFAETDTLCYRAEPDEPLWTRQHAVWEQHLAAAEQRWGIEFIRVSGIIHRPQPPATLARLSAVLAGRDPFTLAALNTLTSLAASLVLGLAALEADADIAHLWDAANLEENWQAELWGQDEEALARIAQRGALFGAAAAIARLA